MKEYLDLCRDILENGRQRSDRTGTGTVGVFGRQLRFQLYPYFPLLTTKKVNIKAVVCELLWMLRGETNVESLNKDGVHIWDANADENGDLGPVYGKQWRRWYHPDGDGSYVDQIYAVIETLKSDPFSRRHIVSAWNVGEIESMRLPPCHILFQFYVQEIVGQKFLSCQMYQRSADVFLGLPFNIASYALLTMMVANVCGMGYGELIISLGDAHIYLNHIDQIKEQLTRKPRVLPSMFIDLDVKNIDAFKYESFKLMNYFPYPPIKGEMSV